MSTISVPPLDFAAPAILGPPRHVACFSVSEDRVVHTDDYSSLAVFSPPPIGADLTEGLMSYKKRCNQDPHYNHPTRLDHICQMHLESRYAVKMLKAQVTTRRGYMKKRDFQF